jgi:nitric oxide reductase large subunit
MTRDAGDCILTRHCSPGRNSLTVERADPRAWIGADILAEISRLTAADDPRWSSLNDDVLTIRADNRTVVYRVDWTAYDASRDTYLAEWPD